MNWIVEKIKWIMIASGALTCTMIYAALAPGAALRSTFGETLEGALAEVVVRNWRADHARRRCGSRYLPGTYWRRGRREDPRGAPL